MDLRALGELRFLDDLRRRIPQDATRVPLGIGDDGAIITTAGSLVVSCDMLIEERHFSRAWSTPEDIGHKALAVNLSDLAAMGAAPEFALLSLAVPGSVAVSDLHRFYDGLLALAGRFGTQLVGGNLAETETHWTVDVTVMGTPLEGGPFLASAAQPGHRVYVTGQLGMAAAGLALLREPHLGAHLAPTWRQALIQAQLRPEPRCAEAAALAQWAAVTGSAIACRDISDGLATSLMGLAAASGVAIEIRPALLPLMEAVQIVAEASAAFSAASRGVAVEGLTPGQELALFGGEDYELCFTAPARDPDGPRQILEHLAGATCIGRVLAGEGVWLQDGTRRQPLTQGGFDHFAHP